MGAMTIRELNANISKAISMVEAGETLDIVKNGKVVAELRPKPRNADAAWRKAHEESIAFLREGIDLCIGKVSTDDKYADASQ